MKPVVYKIAKDSSGLLQNRNERVFAQTERYLDRAPTVYATHAIDNHTDAILTVERVELLSDVLYDFIQEWYTRVSACDDELTYVDCRRVVEHTPIDNTYLIVKHLLIELFESEDNTLSIDQSVNHLFTDICERIQPILVHYFSDLIRTNVFCIEECVVENIGLRPDMLGQMSVVVLDSGIPNTDFLTLVLNMGKQKPIIT